ICLEPVKAELGRADAVERTQLALQHVVQAAVSGGLLDGEPVGGRFHHAQQLRIPGGAGAGGTDRLLAEITAALAMADPLHRFSQDRSEERRVGKGGMCWVAAERRSGV